MQEGTPGGPHGGGRRLYFSASGHTVVAETSEPALLESVRSLFPAYEVGRAGEIEHPADVAIARRFGRYTITSRDSTAAACATRIDAIVAFEFALSRALAAAFSDFVHIHAGGAVVDGRAVLALGDSGAGKSSLAASLWARGHPVLGDDTVLLGAEANAAPFKRLLKVSRVVLDELGVDLFTTVHWDPAWPEAWLDPRSGVGWAEEAPVAAIAQVRYDPTASLDIQSVDRADGLNALVHSVMSTGMPAADGFDRLMRVAQNAKMYCLRFPSATEAADALCSLLK